MIDLKLVGNGQEQPCHLWVGITRKGVLSPSDLINLRSVETILHEAAAQGTSSPCPLALADTTKTAQGPTLVYLTELPNPHIGRQKVLEKGAEESWVQQLYRAILDCSRERVGFYFSPEILGEDLAHNLLLRLLHLLIPNKKIKTYSLLIGSHGMNNILNTALDLKNLVAKDYKIRIHH
ncbi:MAG: hypothetical protein KA436_09305 [Oligoflexales bacterium]|nr:hypothetical protein [Oligoflexales bacterium]